MAIPVLPTEDAPKTAAAFVALFAAALDAQPKTKVVALSHVTTTHGLAFPIKAIAALAHSKGAIVVVDGAQAMGMPVNVSDLGCDVYATSAHKWMLAPKGSGVLYVAKPIQGWVTPTMFDGGYSTYTAQSGTRPTHTIEGLGHAVDYLNSYGGGAIIGKYNLALRAKAYDGIAKLSAVYNFTIIGTPGMRSGPLVSPILAFSLPAPWTSASFAGAMYAKKYIVKQAGRSASANEGGLTMPEQACRITFHMFNSDADVASLVATIASVFASSSSTARRA